MPVRKTYTVAIRMGAAHNDLCELPSRKAIVDLPAPVEAYRGRKPETEAAKARRLKAVGRHNAVMTKIGKDLCSAFGIEQAGGQKGKRGAKRSVPHLPAGIVYVPHGTPGMALAA